MRSVVKKCFLLLFIFLFSTGVSAQNLFRAACQGDVDKLDSLLNYNDINLQDNRGRSLLHYAIGCERNEVFRYLIDQGIQFNIEDNQKRVPLHVAVQFRNETCFDQLVELQPDTRWKSTYGASLLELAVLNRDTVFVKKLIDSGVDVNGKNKRGSTAYEISLRVGATNISRLLLTMGADQKMVRQFDLKGRYLGQTEPGTSPKMFAPNFISTEESEFGSIFNSTGTEFYFAVDVNGRNEIRYSKMVEGKWSSPEIFLSHERYGYNDPFLSPDETRLYFISNQALDGLGEPKDIDIWYVEKREEGWSEPINAGPKINSNRNEYYISFTNEGTMYFSSNANASDEKVRSDYDIYYSKLVDGEFKTPVALNIAINSDGYEADVFVAPDETYLIFCSTRENGYGQGDLYISYRNENGTWTNAVNMGSKINTEHYEYCPFVSKDGKFLFYTSNQDIYWVSTEVFEE